MRWAHMKSINSKDKQKNKMDIGGMAGKAGWDQQAQWTNDQQQKQDNFIGYMKGKGEGWFPKGGSYGKGSKGKGCSPGWNPGWSPGGKSKGKGGYGFGPYQPMAKGKECRETVSTAEKLDTQLGCAPSHRKEEEKEKE